MGSFPKTVKNLTATGANRSHPAGANRSLLQGYIVSAQLTGTNPSSARSSRPTPVKSIPSFSSLTFPITFFTMISFFLCLSTVPFTSCFRLVLYWIQRSFSFPCLVLTTALLFLSLYCTDGSAPFPFLVLYWRRRSFSFAGLAWRQRSFSFPYLVLTTAILFFSLLALTTALLFLSLIFSCPCHILPLLFSFRFLSIRHLYMSCDMSIVDLLSSPL